MIYRYLLRFAYKGHAFRGLQKSTKRLPAHEQSLEYQLEDRKTVQGAIEQGLLHIKPRYQPIVLGSSRTDTGVSAWNSAATVDLCSRNPGQLFAPRTVTLNLNAFFRRAELPVRCVPR